MWSNAIHFVILSKDCSTTNTHTKTPTNYIKQQVAKNAGIVEEGVIIMSHITIICGMEVWGAKLFDLEDILLDLDKEERDVSVA